MSTRYRPGTVRCVLTRLRLPLLTLAMRLLHGWLHQLRFDPVTDPLVGRHPDEDVRKVPVPFAGTMAKVRRFSP